MDGRSSQVVEMFDRYTFKAINHGLKSYGARRSLNTCIGMSPSKGQGLQAPQHGRGLSGPAVHGEVPDRGTSYGAWLLAVTTFGLAVLTYRAVDKVTNGKEPSLITPAQAR